MTGRCTMSEQTCSHQPLKSGLCDNCRVFARVANNTFGLVRSEVMAVEDGWRLARIVDRGFEHWLCPHVHVTPEDAETCPERGSVISGPRTL
jgi:hypothetical protein